MGNDSLLLVLRDWRQEVMINFKSFFVLLEEPKQYHKITRIAVGTMKTMSNHNLHDIEQKKSASNAKKGLATTDCYHRDKIDCNAALLKDYEGEPITQGNSKTIELIHSKFAYKPSQERIRAYLEMIDKKKPNTSV